MAGQGNGGTGRYDLGAGPVLLTGTQALVRLMLMQQARDRAAGRRTAGFVTGYRGSPLGGVDFEMDRAADTLAAADILFRPALNEDLGATSLWGSQQAGLGGEGRFDGVFGLWYGKGPGVDRSGDAMKHANMAGTAPHGGVLMAMGDDHTGESSTTCHQSDLALIDAYMPVLSPAGVQEILDLGLYGYALGRYSGLWCGLKLMKDTVAATAVVDGRPDRMAFRLPAMDLPEGGLNIRAGDHWVAQEERLIRWKRPAAEAFARANRIDRRVLGRPGATLGLVAAGKTWLDLCHALDLLGIGPDEAQRLGITTYKVAQAWPLDAASFREWAEGLETVVVVEEKRKLIETQVKEALFEARHRVRVHGGTKAGEAGILFPGWYALDPVAIARTLGAILDEEGRGSEALAAARARLEDAARPENAPDLAARPPWFCAGCPHNTSTKVPEGARAYAGIGCHTMAMYMDRDTSSYTHMGAEGAAWAGEAPFSTRPHMFQNMGDGTYNHSGLLAVRHAIASGANITYKILYNDAVAMTGGQANDGGLTPDRIVAELCAAGVAEVVVVHDEKEQPERALYPGGTAFHPRDDLMAVQERLSAVPGVTALVYVQTCAAEKRRRRRSGAFPDPETRVFIDPEVCEGCGDCGVQSNCVAIVPRDTALGRKRAIDQSTCNKDYSCLKGFCPSFVTVTGARPRRAATRQVDTAGLPEPALPGIAGTHNIVLTGIGGTGVVTLGAVLARAAHAEGKGVALMEMAGLAQKGGAVTIHCRIAERPGDITAVRVARGEGHVLVGGDLVVSAASATLSLLAPGAGAVVNGHETMTGAFTRAPDFRLPGRRMALALTARLGEGAQLFDASRLARETLGDTIYANMIVLGACWQRGLLPLTHAALVAAIGAGPAGEANRRAFEIGRWAALNPEDAGAEPGEEAPETLEQIVETRAAHLAAYQSPRLARRYRDRVAGFADPDLARAVALGYHKLLARKDEYEVARLLAGTRARLSEEFEGTPRLAYHLAPPLLAGQGPDGRPAKRRFGPWIERLFPLLARGRHLRDTPLDPFGYTAERRMERALLRDYEEDLDEIAACAGSAPQAALVALAELPLAIRGFGPVKQANAETAARRRAELLQAIRAGGAPLDAAAAE